MLGDMSLLLTTMSEKSQEISVENVKKELRQKGMLKSFLMQQNVKSKKKRMLKKTIKKAMAEINVIEEKAEIEQEKSNVVEPQSVQLIETKIFDFSKTPVTLLLKIGKKYLNHENVVKSYYNSNQPDFYKNKELLVQTMETEIPKLEQSLQKEIEELM